VFDFVADERTSYDPQVRHAQLIAGEPIGIRAPVPVCDH
jgi:hypothetical protein